MQKKFLSFPILVLAIAAISYGQSVIALCGTVKDAAGVPVAGATVKLEKKNLTALSGIDGKYCINWNAGVSLRWENREIAGSCALSRTTLSVTLGKGDRFAAALFDIRGRMLWKKEMSSWGAGRHEMPVPVKGFSSQAEFLRVNAGSVQRTFGMVGCGGTSFVFSEVNSTNSIVSDGSLEKASRAAGAFPILDTLMATGQGFAKNNAIRSYVYAYVDTIDFALGEPDSFSEARQQIVHRINDYRATLGLKRLIRKSTSDLCVDTQAHMDYISNVAHSAFGHCNEFAQNECPGWKNAKMLTDANNIVISCLQMMWDEGPPPAGTPCGNGTTCYSQHGHYINMTNTSYSKIACGFYYNPVDSSMWAAHDFF